jgi:DNA-binding response OmpR family regulator
MDERSDRAAPPGDGLGADGPGPVLVIDDEPYILRSICYVLAQEGFQVKTASNGEDGLARARADRPPIVIVDIMMPRMDGYQVCEAIRQDPELAGTYIIILSAKGQQIDRERGLLGGADEYMTKPFSPRELVQRVREAMASRRGVAHTAGTTDGANRNVRS